METEERTFPLTRLTSEVVAVANAIQSETKDERPPAMAIPRRQELTLSKILKRIFRVFGNSAESSQYYFLARNLDKNTDEDATSTNPEKRQLRLSMILKEIVRAFGKNEESQYYFMTRSSYTGTDNSEPESEPELDSCSL